MKLRYCVLYNGKRSRAVSLERAKRVQRWFRLRVAGDVPIKLYSDVKELEIYNAFDLYNLLD